MKPQLPLEVLGLMGPILCWVEGSERVELPERWHGAGYGVRQRVGDWLVRELPNYSRDSISDVRSLGRERERGRWSAVQPEPPGTGRRREVPRLISELRLDPPERYDLSDVFDRLGERYFEWSGNELTVQWPKVAELHELAMRFPVRHLIRFRHARAVESGVINADRALELPEQMSSLHSTSRGIRAVVEEGLTEGHMHLWGVMSADEGWADHIARKLSARSLDRFEPHERRLIWLSRLTSRTLALAAVHEVLGQRSQGAELEPLMQLVDRIYWSTDRREVRHLRLKLRGELREKIRELPSFWQERDREASREKIDWLFPLLDPSANLIWSRSRPRRGLGRLSGVRLLLRLVENLHLTVHRQLLALRKEEVTRGGEDVVLGGDGAETDVGLFRSVFHGIFYRYLIFNTHYWQLATQSGRTTGVREFKRFYDARQRVLLTDDAEVQGLVFERLSYSPSVQFVEGRLSPPRVPDDLVPWVLAYAAAAERGEMEKFGLVINFLKGDQDEIHEGGRSRAGRTLLRHGRTRRLTRNRAEGLYRLLSTPHPAVPFVVGIDAANLELTTPPEVFAPAFRFLREYPISLRRTARYLRGVGAYRQVAELVDGRRLGLTYHVGEDFRHLLSGLRAIDEVIRFLDPRPGDRLGHAIALGMDPEVWAAQIGYQAVMPRQELLDTAVWAYFLLGPGHPLAAELDLEDTIYRLGRRIYTSDKLSTSDEAVAEWSVDPSRERGNDLPEGEDRRGRKAERLMPLEELLSPQTLYESWQLRQLDPGFLNPVHLCLGQGSPAVADAETDEAKRWHRCQRRVFEEMDRRYGSQGAYRLLYKYWYDRDARAEGQKIEPLDMLARKPEWLEACHEIQAKLRKKVERRQLVVEVNPSSNRVVGPIGGYDEHHVFRLTLGEDGKPLREIPVTINTDDPGVFNTSLAHEYYLLAEIMTHRFGKSESETVEWLSWLRKNGHDYSFVRSLPSFSDRRIQTLLGELRRTYPRLPPKLSGERKRTVEERFRTGRRGGSPGAPSSGDGSSGRGREEIPWTR